MTLLFWLCVPFTLIGMWLVGVTVWVTCGGQPRREPWQTKERQNGLSHDMPEYRLFDTRAGGQGGE